MKITIAAATMHAPPTPTPTPRPIFPSIFEDVGLDVAIVDSIDIEVEDVVIVAELPPETALLVLILDIVLLLNIMPVVDVVVLDIVPLEPGTPTVAANSTRVTSAAQHSVELRSPPQHHFPSVGH